MSKTSASVGLRRGEVYLVNFDPTIGAEIRKTRPALIIQNDVANRYSPVTVVAAITTQFDEPLYPTEVLLESSVGGVTQRSVVLLNQLRTIDRRRLIRRLGVVSSLVMIKVDRAITISLGLVAR